MSSPFSIITDEGNLFILCFPGVYSVVTKNRTYFELHTATSSLKTAHAVVRELVADGVSPQNVRIFFKNKDGKTEVVLSENLNLTNSSDEFLYFFRGV